jgi:hypothetical protein
MNMIAMTGMRFAPTYSTTPGNLANFGTIRGLHCINPALGLFQPGGGTEIMTAYYAVDVAALPFGGNVPKVALRSGITVASNARFLDNTGGADSDFGTGDIFLDDNTFLKLGNTLANADISMGWSSTQSAIVLSTFFGINNNPLFLRPSATNTWTFQHNNAGTLDIGLGFNVNAISFGVVDPVPDANNWFVQFQGPNLRKAWFAGVYSDVFWTAGGQIDVNGFALTEVNSFRIDPNVTLLNGGTVQDQSGLFIAGMGFPGSGAATRLQSLRVTGRSRFDGVMNHNEATLATLTANVAALALPVTNSGRFMLLEDADALGPWAIQGIVNIQPGDSIYIINTGANAFTLNHQDVAAAAADRIISPTGVNLTLGQDEMAKLWYDPAATRWRILETTGA